MPRTDRASRVVDAPPEQVYVALTGRPSGSRRAGPPTRAWRDRIGAVSVGAGEHLRDAGRRLQHVPDAPVALPCADC